MSSWEKVRREAFEKLAKFKEFVRRYPEIDAKGRREVRALEATLGDGLVKASQKECDEKNRVGFMKLSAWARSRLPQK